MALRTDQLHEENLKLRGEIRKLQQALKTLSIDTSIRDQPSPVRSPSWRLDDDRKEALVQEIKEKLDRGIYSPPKLPRSRGRSASHKDSGSRSRSTSRNNTRRSGTRDSEGASLQQELAEELSSIEVSLGTIQTAKPELGPSLRKELDHLKKSVVQITGKSPAKESFDSPETDPDTSAQLPTPKGQSLAKEIEALRHENEYLRSQLAAEPRTRSKSPSLTPRGRRSRSNSCTPRSPHSKSPLRMKHCKICDYLLSKGFSTVYCTKHGSK